MGLSLKWRGDPKSRPRISSSLQTGFQWVRPNEPSPARFSWVVLYLFQPCILISSLILWLLLFQALFNSFIYRFLSQSQSLFGKLQAFSELMHGFHQGGEGGGGQKMKPVSLHPIINAESLVRFATCIQHSQVTLTFRAPTWRDSRASGYWQHLFPREN